MSTPESAWSLSLEGEGLIIDLGLVLVVGKGILDTGRGIPLGGLRDLLWSIASEWDSRETVA